MKRNFDIKCILGGNDDPYMTDLHLGEEHNGSFVYMDRSYQ